MNKLALAKDRGTDNQHPPGAPVQTKFASHAAGSPLQVQSTHFVDPHFPFQPLPTPNGQAPFRFDLTQLLHADAIAKIQSAGRLVFHTTGDTGDDRGRQMDFVAAMMTADYESSPADAVPAFFYHLGDIVYFAGDVDAYGENFYETYAEYPGPIVAIAGNHDCQPDDPQDGPVDPNKVPLDGWVQNFMSKDPSKLGSLKTNSSRTQMDLPNVYWTFMTPFATIIGLFTNVSETQAAVHPDQLSWFKSELKAAPTDKALIVAIHHPPFSGDSEHSGSSEAEKILFESFTATGRYPNLIMSGHVHNYQRFTAKEGNKSITCLVAGNGGYTRLGRLNKIGGGYPQAPLKLSDTLTLEEYDQTNFGFVRIEVTKTQIVGSYHSAPYDANMTGAPSTKTLDAFVIELDTYAVGSAGGQPQGVERAELAPAK